MHCAILWSITLRPTGIGQGAVPIGRDVETLHRAVHVHSPWSSLRSGRRGTTGAATSFPWLYRSTLPCPHRRGQRPGRSENVPCPIERQRTSRISCPPPSCVGSVSCSKKTAGCALGGPLRLRSVVFSRALRSPLGCIALRTAI